MASVKDNTGFVTKRSVILAMPLYILILAFIACGIIEHWMTGAIWSHVANAVTVVQSSLSALTLIHNIYEAALVSAANDAAGLSHTERTLIGCSSVVSFSGIPSGLVPVEPL